MKDIFISMLESFSIKAFAGSGSDRYISETGEGGPLSFLIPFMIVGVFLIIIINYIRDEYPSKSKVAARDESIKVAKQIAQQEQEKRTEQARQAEIERNKVIEAGILAATTYENFFIMDFDSQWKAIQKEGREVMHHMQAGEIIATVYHLKGGFSVEYFYNSGSPHIMLITDWLHIGEEYVTIQDAPNGYDIDYDY